MSVPLGPAACGHDAAAVAPPMCAHLRETRNPWLSYDRCYIGVGFEHLLLCILCADEFDAGRPPPVMHVCGDCLEFATSEVGDLTGVRGQPEVLDHPEEFDGTVRNFDLPRMRGPLIDLAHAERERRWYGLCADGTVVRFTPDWERADPVASVALDHDPDHKPFVGRELRQRLHVAPSGRFAAVANDYGRLGVVVNIESGVITLHLDGGDYHPETVPFSMTFAEFAGRDVIVHRTAWNRLDVCDPGSGQVLTERGPTSYQRGEDRPEHYLDYFHGRLYVSPDGARLLDDGWVWHPIGIPEVWDRRRWLSENVWESEDGPSKLSLDGRDYYWDHGMCWIDAQRVAVEGIGSDDMHMIAGARIFDVTERAPSSKITWPTARELFAFAGPTGDFFSDGARLFSVDGDGLSIWSIDVGARTGQIPGFKPRHHARADAALVEIRNDQVAVWRHG